MTEKIYLGNGWENQYGLKVSINIEKLNQAIATGKLEVNKYGNVKINVGKLKQPNKKSKATHFVAVPKPITEAIKTIIQEYFKKTNK